MVIQAEVLSKIVNPVAIMQPREIQSVTKEYGVWLPKKCLEDVKFVKTDILPNITVRFPLKSDPAVFPYKCELRAKLQHWLAQQKNLLKDCPPREEKHDVREARAQW